MRSILFVVLIISIIACNKSIQRDNEITKVELAKEIAISNKGTVIDIDSSLNYKFYRFRRFFRNPGKNQSFYYTGKVDASFWDTLNSKFERIKYKTLDTNKKLLGTDGESYELIVYWKNGRKRIMRYIPSQPDSLISLLDWLDSSYKKANLKQTKTPFKFETTYQNPIPPRPKIDQVKFPPP